MQTNSRSMQKLLFVVALSVLAPLATAQAQDSTYDPNATPTTYNASPPPANDPPARNNDDDEAVGDDGLRLAIQARLDLRLTVPGLANNAHPGVPVAAVGVRLLDQRLFVGLGLAFGGFSTTQCMGMTCDTETTVSASYFGVAPTVTFDVLRKRFAALYLAGWFNFLSYSATRQETTGAPAVETGGGSLLGLNVALGLRGQIVDGLAIGTEFGWGFLSGTDDGNATGVTDDRKDFIHGIFATVMFEGSIGL